MTLKAVPPLLDNLVTQIVPPVVHLSQFLDSFDDVEERVKFYCDIIEPYHDHFLNLFNASKKGDDKMKLDSGVRVYGINHVRDLVLALKITEIMEPEKGFQWDPKTFKPKIPPENTVKYARKALMHFGEDSRYKNVAYASGLVFDILAAITAKAAGEHSMEIKNLIEYLYDQALSITDSAFSIMKDGTVVTLEIYIVMVCLMRNAGKIAMALLDPSYLEVMKIYKNKTIPPLFQKTYEEHRYQVHHNMLGAVLAQALPSQSKAFFATLCFDNPTFLQGRENKLHFDLAAVCQRGYFKSFPLKQPKQAPETP